MERVEITCDKCGLLIQPRDDKFDSQQVAGGASLSTLRYGGQMGHNRVPLEGWHFHYLCFCEVVRAIQGVLGRG